MPSYHEIMETDLSALTTAADRWDGMAAEFAKQEQAYRRDVQKISMGTTWTGLSADAAHARFDFTLQEFQNAQTEAKAVAKLLRDAHGQFVELRGKLKTARQEAIEAGMKVSDQGVVSLDVDRMSEDERRALHHDPGYMEAVRSWQEHINQAVQNVTDADAGVEVALKAVVIDSDVVPGGFNGAAEGDVEVYEGQEAEELLEKLNNGDRLTDKEIAELKRAFRDNTGDQEFSRTVLDGLGAGGTIRLTNELNDLIHVRGGSRVSDYQELETGLANTLASATKDTKSPWYQEWRKEMRKAGVERYGTDAQGVRLDKAVGYQSLVTLMQKGHGYSRGMLEDLTDDMIAAEKKDSDIWRLKGEYNGKHGGWFANDPVDGMLGIMSHDPGTAADYLKSDARMKYLMQERDWNVVLHEHEGPKVSTYAPGLDGDDRAGFGAALQAAATGVNPSDPNAHYVDHGPDNNKVFTSAFNYLADAGDKFPPSLREPMAAMLVNRGDTVHASMSQIDIDGSPLDQTKLFEVVKQVSKDQDAYGVLNGGLNQALVADIHRDHSASTDSLIRAGRTVGFLEEARIEAQGDPKTADFEAKPLFDKAISYIPVAGDDVQQGFDYVTGQWLEDEQKRLDDQQTKDNIKAYENRNGQLVALANEWSSVHSGNRSQLEAQADINVHAQAGLEHAKGVSGKVSK
ncbi:WXG100 family type VII secretion target [Streptomyces griseosporeus]|uniref:hypothetical protein n=1 Tax=Streptomyces griseosporeus TaxID=1910 RepID=UPI0036F97292